MELGATVCTPAKPQCSKCPVSSHCTAFKEIKSKKRPHSEAFTTELEDEKCGLCQSEEHKHFVKFKNRYSGGIKSLFSVRFTFCEPNEKYFCGIAKLAWPCIRKLALFRRRSFNFLRLYVIFALFGLY
jgi:adenine-specific DNA glycosylase